MTLPDPPGRDRSPAPLAAFWQGRRVLVTGHTGFKGAWLCLWLSRMGAHVHGFALPPETRPSLFEQARIADRVKSQTGDIRDAAEVDAVMRSAKPEVVFHLAAQSLVRRSYAEPVQTFATNVMGTVHLLEAVRHASSVRAVVVVTSDKCYENRNLARGYAEKDPMGGHDPYSASKGCAELATTAWRRSFFNSPCTAAIATARAGNVIGGGDWSEDRLLPDLLRAFAAGVPARIRNPDATRPWQHVLEPLAGYLKLAEALFAGEPCAADGWNFGPDAEANAGVGAVADLAAAAWGAGAAWTGTPGPHPHEAHRLLLDASRARNLLGWRPQLTLAEAVEITVGWHRALSDGADARLLCGGQIDSYVARAPFAASPGGDRV